MLSVDERVADSWGRLVARSEAAGTPLGVMDAFIAATATVHELTLVTRNQSDFKSAVSQIINPWTG